jgi:hypothetical protein
LDVIKFLGIFGDNGIVDERARLMLDMGVDDDEVGVFVLFFCYVVFILFCV